MRFMPSMAPIYDGDIRSIYSHLLNILQRTYKDLRNKRPLLCTLSVEWQSEDRHRMEHITRFDPSYIKNRFFEGDAVPVEQAVERIAMSSLSELLVASEIAYRQNVINEESRECLRRSIPEHFSHAHTTLVLWPGCGMLFLSLLTNLGNANLDREFVDNIRDDLLNKHRSFRDCRTNDEKWLKRNGFEWDMKPQK